MTTHVPRRPATRLANARPTPRTLRLLGLLAPALLVVAACDDAGGGGSDGFGPLQDARTGAGGNGGFGGIGGAGGAGGAGAAGGVGGEGGEGGEGGQGGDGGQGGVGGAGGEGGEPGECLPGMARCLSEGGTLREICREDSRWVVAPCDNQGVCFDGVCLPSPAGCQAGEHLCLDTFERLACDPATESWVAGEACADDEICRGGECRPRACALAEAENSYLGCEYLAVELPNSAHAAAPNGTTPDSPVGLVVANPSETASASITILGPDGQPARLMAQTTVRVPAIPDIQGLYSDQRQSSVVRDANGNVVEDNIAQANPAVIPPGGTGTFLLPRLGNPVKTTGVVRRAFRMTSDSPVAAYQFSPLCCNFSFSNDASLLIPVHAYGSDYRFLGVPAWTSSNIGATPEPATMTIAAAQDDTEVTIRVPAGQAMRADQTGRLRQQGNTFTATLAAGEVLMLHTEPRATAFAGNQPDMSGAVITTSQNVALFSSHSCAFYPETQGACDHLEEQLFPTGTWGREFALVPPVRRAPAGGAFGSTEAVYWKIQAREAGTRIHLSRPYDELGAVAPGYRGVPDCRASLEDPETIVLQGNAFCEFGTMEPLAIQSDIPLMVMGIISGQGSTGVAQPFGAEAGDPAIFLLPPDSQYRDDYVFLTPDTYANDFVTVVADAAATITLDGAPVNLADATPVPGAARVFKHLPLSDGPHRLVGDSPFGILVFAFDDFVSYAFTGGLNLVKR